MSQIAGFCSKYWITSVCCCTDKNLGTMYLKYYNWVRSLLSKMIESKYINTKFFDAKCKIVLYNRWNVLKKFEWKCQFQPTSDI